MYPIEVLPAALAERSLSRRHIFLEATLAAEAISWLASHGWAVTSLETRYFESHGDMGGFEEGLDCEPWRRGERWADHARSVAEACLRELSEREIRFARAPEGEGPPLYVRLDAWPANPYLEQINALLLRYFPGMERIDLTAEATEAPLLAANLRRDTPSFTEGQKVYVHNLSWNNKAMVVGRYRRKHRWICGYCNADRLDNFRPKIVRDPHVIEALRRRGRGRHHISARIFRCFLPFPAEPKLL